MESHEVLKQAFESSQTSPKQIASEMGVSLSLVYKWAQPNTESGSGSRNPLDRVSELMELTREPAIAEWLCDQAGWRCQSLSVSDRVCFESADICMQYGVNVLRNSLVSFMYKNRVIL